MMWLVVVQLSTSSASDMLPYRQNYCFAYDQNHQNCEKNVSNFHSFEHKVAMV